MKRIALGLFLGGMAVCAANAADPVRAVASKGYVDSVTGLLSGLNTRLDNTSLVAAINDLFSGFSSFELFSNKTQEINASSTATQYPSAKAVYDTAVVPLNNKEDKSNKTQTIDTSSTAEQYPSAAAVHTAVNAKQNKSTADYQVGKADGTWQTLTPAEQAALQSGVTTSTVSQVTSNTNELGNKVNVDQGDENKVMVTDASGRVIPAPLEVCEDETSKCVLTFGKLPDGTVGFEWEVIAR